MPRIIAFSLCLLLLACATPEPEAPVYAAARPVNLAGNWEVDYGRSDNIQQRLNALFRQLQQEAERRARAAERGRAVSGPPLSSGRNLVALAEMAELITAPELLEIAQTADEIRIKRDSSFALVCETDQPPPVVRQTPFGNERCGWSASQLYFDINLPDGLQIRHRITGSDFADSLLIQTAVYSPVVSEPFVVNKVYTRYQPEESGYRCTQTLSKGRVCTTESAP